MKVLNYLTTTGRMFQGINFEQVHCRLAALGYLSLNGWCSTQIWKKYGVWGTPDSCFIQYHKTCCM